MPAVSETKDAVVREIKLAMNLPALLQFWVKFNP